MKIQVESFRTKIVDLSLAVEEVELADFIERIINAERDKGIEKSFFDYTDEEFYNATLDYVTKIYLANGTSLKIKENTKRSASEEMLKK